MQYLVSLWRTEEININHLLLCITLLLFHPKKLKCVKYDR